MTTTLRMTFLPYGGLPSWTIEVNSVSFDGEQTLNIGSSSTGAGAGKVTFNPLSFSKKPDIHSADLWSRMCNGTPFQKVSLDVASSATAVPFITFAMGLVAVKTISFSAAEGDGYPTETVTVLYGAAAYSVSPQNPDGTLGKAVGAGWDRVKNVSLDPSKVGAA